MSTNRSTDNIDVGGAISQLKTFFIFARKTLPKPVFGIKTYISIAHTICKASFKVKSPGGEENLPVWGPLRYITCQFCFGCVNVGFSLMGLWIGLFLGKRQCLWLWPIVLYCLIDSDIKNKCIIWFIVSDRCSNPHQRVLEVWTSHSVFSSFVCFSAAIFFFLGTLSIKKSTHMTFTLRKHCHYQHQSCAIFLDMWL